jgi:hypothetical protein
MSMGDVLMRESSLRLDHIRRPASSASGRLFRRVLHWGAWLNYLVSIIALTAGITAGWRFAEIGFDLMMTNASGEEVTAQVIRKIPAWILVYKGIKTW